MTFLFGCAPKYPYDPAEFSKGQKSAAVISSKALYKRDLFFKMRSAASLLKIYWKSTTSQESFISLNRIPMFDDSESVYEIYQILPGEYYIEKCEYSGTSGPVMFTVKYRIKKGKIKFNIKPGEVSYLGDILLNDEKEEGDIIINDSFVKVKDYIRDNYPELASQLKKNLIQSSVKSGYGQN